MKNNNLTVLSMIRITLCVLLLISSPFSLAEKSSTLREAVEKAALTHPAVEAAWHALEAADSGVRAAKGGYLPRLDLTAQTGHERTEVPVDVENDYDANSYRLTMTQMLFDGFATKQDVAEQNFLKLVRYYEFRQISEELALETAQAYLDVLRYRDLVKLAEENYLQHQRYHRDIQRRVESGIGRGVDLEQSKARLALAESNLWTEQTNLHDVSVRFHRLVGEFPDDTLTVPEVAASLIPDLRSEAMVIAFNSNPELNAAIEGIRVSRADYRGKKAPYLPRFDLRLRKEYDDNDRGIEGEYDEEAIELVMTYNLYNGGSDKARRKQSKFLMYEAEDRRETVCRNVRQNVAIAYNDIQAKARLLEYLEANAVAIKKAREAYKDQFDIGQLTLLDLLDTENEYFEVSRTLVNARNEYTLAQYRTLAAMGWLLRSMGVSGMTGKLVEKLDLEREDSLNAYCEPRTPSMSTDVPKAIIAPASEQIKSARLSDREVMKLDVKFRNGSAEMIGGLNDELQRVADFLCNNASLEGVVEGHTDSRGSAQYNQQLSQARADAVRLALTQACPSATGRLSSTGYGEARPVARNDSEAGRAANRRVELLLIGGAGT